MPHRADTLFAAVLLVLVILALIFQGQLIADPPIQLSRDFSPLNPKIFPTLVLVGTGLVALIFILMQAAQGEFKRDAKVADTSAREDLDLRRPIAFFVLTIFCALLFPYAGFLTTMFILMVSTSLLVGNRNIVQILVLSTVLPLTFYIAVTHILKTSLPELDFIEKALTPLMQFIPSL